MRQTAIPTQTTAQLSVRLFGPIELQQNSVPCPRPRTRKELWLLALLALRHRASCDRRWLAVTLWPDSDETQALRNLRRSLSNLREVLGTEAYRLFAPTPRTISLDLSGASCDVHEFDALITRGDTCSLEAAVALYRGPLLDGCLEEWAIQECDARARAYLDALETLAGEAAANQDAARQVRVLRRIVSADPFRETAQCALMTALAAGGDRAGAMLVYRQFRLRLHEELQAEPEAQTTALYRRLRDASRLPAFRNAGDSRTMARASANPPGLRHLPHSLSGLVGRTQELAEITTHLLQTRLLTLTGVGGIGKTRLAIAVAEKMLPDFSEGIWFVDLAPLVDANLVATAVARSLGVREDAKRPLAETLREYLAPRRLLLVLDNCEHLLPGCARFVNTLLQGCPRLQVLATSRQALGLRGEIAWRVPSLSLPPPTLLPANGGGASPASPLPLPLALLESDAARLFLERAMETSPTFALTERNAPTVAQICRRLDGIPLAIELAAARAKALSIEQIARRLDRVFTLLTAGSMAELPRHRTLRALLDWSYALLNNQEKALLCRLSVFIGGWTLEVAEGVGTGADVLEEDVLDLLTSLVDKSLVTAEAREEETRYRLLETVRQYAAERLNESGEYPAVRARHGHYFLTLAEEVSPKLLGAEQGQWLDVLEEELDNLRQALTGYAQDFEEREAGEKGLRLGVALRRFWWVRGHLREGRERLAALLAHPGAQARAKLRADALASAGLLARMQGDHAAARALHEESLTIQRELGDKIGIADSLNHLGIVALEQGDCGRARPLLEESLTLRRELRNKSGIAASLVALGNVAREQGDYAAAQVKYEESLTLRREVGDKINIANSISNLGGVAYEQGDYDRARLLHEESLTLRRELGDKGGVAISVGNLGGVIMEQGDYAAAHACLQECLTLCRELGDKLNMLYTLEACAGLAHRRQQQVQAVGLWSAAAALRETMGCPLRPLEHDRQRRERTAARETLGCDAFALAWAQGRVMALEQAVEYALQGTGNK